jgi:seipin
MFQDAVLAPIRLASSKRAQRAYLSTLLLLAAAFVLAGLSITAYILFYNAYIPRIGFERVVHLQFPVAGQASSSVFPWGAVDLKGELVSGQPYDVSLVLHVPRSPANLGLGNFMLDLQLWSPGDGAGPGWEESGVHPDAIGGSAGGANGSTLLARSTRPVILTYVSSLVDQVGTVAMLPLLVSGFKKESEWIEKGMMEGVQFKRGWSNVPRSVRVEIKTDAGASGSSGRVAVYGCWVQFRARLGGLRWLMYNHRIISAIAFTATFFSVSMTFMLLAYVSLSYIFSSSRKNPASNAPPRVDRGPASPSSKTPNLPTIKKEEEEDPDLPSLSDTPRTFPTLRNQPPLSFSSSQMKSELSDPGRDSGLGSSLPENAPRPSSSSVATAAARYPTPSVNGEDEDDDGSALQPTTPGEAADDEDDEVDFVEDDDGGGEGTGRDVRSEMRDSVRRRRGRLSGHGAGDGDGRGG